MTVYDGTVTNVHERVMGPGNPRATRHAENPDRPGWALCGIRLRSSSSSPAGHRCLVCTDLARPSYVDR